MGAAVGLQHGGRRARLRRHVGPCPRAAAFKAQASAVQGAGGAASRAETLRQAQLAMIDGTLGAGRWSHPFFWSPYALFADPVR